jgi:hypothetical protein
MFDFLKNLTKSDEEKQQEAFSAYLDDKLSPSQRRDFEAQLAEDADLRADMELAQLVRQQMNEMPRRSVPRSFTLDANGYGAPQKEPLVQAYPFLRAATVMTAFFFVIALGLSIFTTQGGGSMASVAQTAMEPAPAFDAPLAEAEISIEATTEEPAASERITEAVIVEEEAMQEEPAAAEEAALLSTMTAASTKSTELALTDEAALETYDLESAAAPVEESEGESQAGAVGEAATPTSLPTATASSLPRPDAPETAVPRAIEPDTTPPDEMANAADGETAVTETQPPEPLPQQPARPLTTSEILLIGLGLLLLILIAVTLLARRKI